MGLKHVFLLQLLKQPPRAIPAAAISSVHVRTVNETRHYSNDLRKRGRSRTKGRPRQDFRGSIHKIVCQWVSVLCRKKDQINIFSTYCLVCVQQKKVNEC